MAATKTAKTETSKPENKSAESSGDGGGRPNKVKITDVGPSRKKIHIEIPAETVTEQFGTSIDTLMVEAELPGFRKGRAPKRLVERRFGSVIQKEAKNALVSTAFNKAIEDNKLRVIGEATAPELEKLELVMGKPLAFDLEVEVLPTFELPKLDGIDVKKPLFDVTDAAVKTELDRLLLNEGRLESKDKPGKGDYLTGHAIMKEDKAGGAEHLNIQDAVIQIPTDGDKGMILGVNVDDFAKQIGHPKIGETLTIKTTGPEGHENEAIRGKNLVITFQVKRADHIIPAKAEEIAAKYGMASVSEVTDAMRQKLEQRVQVDQQTAMRQQVAKYLMEHTTIEMPERITAQQAGRNLERTRMELMYRGVDQQKIEENLANLRAAAANSAVSELKIFFILDKAAEALDVKVSDAEINGRISQMAAARNERPEKLRQEIIARNQVGTVYTQIREHKTMDAILAKAKVTEMPLDEFNKLVQAHNAEVSKGKGAAKPAAKKEDHPAKDKDEEAKPKAKSAKK